MSTSPPKRDPLKEDFKLFLCVLWLHLGLPQPTRSQLVLADWLQHGPNRLVIEAFRGIGKSIVTCAYVAWRLYQDPNRKMMLVSASKIHADNLSTFILKIIKEFPPLAHLAPQGDDRDSKVMFDVAGSASSKDPSVKSVGIRGQLTGSRANEIIADDIEVPNNSATQLMRDQIAELVKEFAAIILPLQDSKIVYLGTPQTEQSLYNKLPERGYEVRIIPSRYPTEAQALRYGTRLASYVGSDLAKDPALAGKPVCERFPDEVLMEKMSEYGQAGFALQFMLDTTLSDADRYPLKLHDLIVMDIDPERAPRELAWSNDQGDIISDLPNVGFDGDRYYRPFMVNKENWGAYTGKVMAIDPSGRGQDELAYAVVFYLAGRLFLVDAGGLEGGYRPENLKALAEIAKRYKVNEVVVEPNFGDGMFTQLLTPVMADIYPCTVTDSERSRGQKEARIIDSLEPVIQSHRLVVDKGLIERDYKSTEGRTPETQNRYRLFYQMTRITKDRGSLAKDDRVDALAIAVHYWTTQMDRDTEKAAQQAREEALRKELEVHMRFLVRKPQGGLRVVRGW